MPTPPFKTLSSNTIWSCPYFSVRAAEVTLPNKEQSVYYVMEKNPCVFIVPITKEGEIIMIRQYRYAVDDWCWEVPAGGKKDHHSLEETAREELLEEIGGVAESIAHLGMFYLSCGTTNEAAHLFVATNVTLGQHHHEPMEVIEIHRKPIAEALELAKSGKVMDGPSALALLLAERHIR